jgi:hypothetical protein
MIDADTKRRVRKVDIKGKYVIRRKHEIKRLKRMNIFFLRSD